jgi:phosphoglucomutase
MGPKFNADNGAPAPESLTDKTYTCADPKDRETPVRERQPRREPRGNRRNRIGYDGGSFIVEVVDPVGDYLATTQTTFDFAAIRALTDFRYFSTRCMRP